MMLTSMKADAPLIIWGESCPEVSGMANFDVSQYTGQWFQLSALPFVLTSSRDPCVWSNYTLLPNGNLRMINSVINVYTNFRYALTGEAALVGNATLGELDVEFFMNPNSTANPNYFVLNTDYTEFSYVWNCDSYLFMHIPKLWILNRNSERASAYTHVQVENALEILKKNHYDSRSIDKVRKGM